ncbi:MAG: ATP-binding protein [Lachnospiraceae bacterium]|nr:ATP-binding protein [Lachnospiraceae bacterium]
MDEIKLNKNEKILLFAVCVLMNIAGKFLSSFFHLPLWLDTAGTCVSAFFLGPFLAMAVGALNNIAYGFSVHAEFAYVLTNMIVALGFSLGVKRKNFNTFTRVLITGFMVGLFATFCNTPLTMVMYKGGTGNVWGDGIYGSLVHKGNPIFVATLLSNLFLDVVDKQISAVLAFVVIRKFLHYFLRVRSHEDHKSKLKITLVVSLVLSVGLPVLLHFEGGCLPTPEMLSQKVQSAKLQSEVEKWEKEDILPETSSQSQAANGETFDGTYIETIFNNSNGLSGSEANAIAQTEDGYIWIGSYAGLTKYDGTKFTYIHENNLAAITALLTDKKGNLWIGTNDSGVVCYDGSNYTSFTMEDGLSSHAVRSLALSYDGSVYVGTASSLCKINVDGTVENVDAEIGTVVSMATDGDNLYAVSSSGSLYVYQDDQVDVIMDGSKDNFSAVTMADDGLWAGTDGNEVMKLVLNNHSLSVEKRISTGNINSVNELYQDAQGRIWVAASGGLGYIDNGRNFYSKKYDEFSGAISHVFQDAGGNLWFASTRFGVMELSKNRFVNILHASNFEKQTVNAVVRKNGYLYVGSDNGLYILDERSGAAVETTLSSYLKDVRIRSIYEDSKGNLWFATYGDTALLRYSENGEVRTFTEEKEKLTSNRIRCIYEMQDGRIVVGTVNGLNVIQNDAVVETYTAEDGMLNTQILCITEGPDGEIVVGSDGAGIYVIKDGEIQENVTTRSGLTSDVVLRLTPYANGYFAVTSNSLCFVKSMFDQNCARTLTNFPYYNNYDLIVQEGVAYITGSSGLYIADAESLAADEPTEYIHYGYNEGLTEGLTSNSWNVLTETGDLYLCSNAGVILMDADFAGKNNVVFSIGLDYVNADGENIKPEGRVYNIPATVGEITIAPTVCNYDRGGVRVAYYVEKLQDNMEAVSSKEIEAIHITHLEGGIYKIVVQVLADDNETVLGRRTFLLNKEHHLWEYAWFVVYIILMLLWLAFSAIWSVLMIQVEQRKKTEMDTYRMQAKNEFMANMSHEIITPVNAILGMNALILHESENRRIENYAKNIDTNCNVLLGLLRGVIDYSSIEDGKMSFTNSTYSLPSLISDIMDMTREGALQKGISLTTEVQEEAPKLLEGDLGRIRQMAGNLVSNAVKYTKQGSIHIKVWTDDYAPYLEARSYEERREEYREDGFLASCDTLVCISVKDTGVGIKEKNLDKIFESFSNREAKKGDAVAGTGLGLAITKGLVNMMGGDIKVESTYGSGSTFTLRVPQRNISKDKMGNLEDAMQEAKDQEKEASFAAPTARILCVDDNETNLAVVKGLLKRMQIIPVLATSGAEALKETNKERFDLIILDHMMPEMDGIECMKIIREDKHNSNKDTPIIVCTANALPGMREEYLKDGFNEFIGKPVESQVLEQMLLKFLPKQKIKTELEKDEKKQGSAEFVAAMQKEGERIDHKVGQSYSGGDEEVYQEILASYINQSEKYLMDLPQAVMNKDWATYALETHAMKSTSKTIGAVSFSDFALRMEKAAKEEDVKTIETNHEYFIEEYRKVIEEAIALLPKKSAPRDKQKLSDEDYRSKVEAIREALKEFDMTGARTLCEELAEVTTQSEYAVELEKKMDQVDEAMRKYDYAGALLVIDAFLKD